jgi:undecaprenyl-phosphate 4-deoxy-4-formamido-L-arabinose transferase
VTQRAIGTEGVSVIVPVYNAEGTLAALCERLRAVLAGTGRPFEVVLVEDRGRDRSWEVICELSSADERIRGIRMSRNYGQHSALLCGLRAARYPISVTLDDDLQNPPEEIPRLLEVLDSGYDVVYGTPQQEQHGLFRDLASKITKLALQSAMGAETARKTSAFRVLRTDVRDAFAEFRGPFVVIDVLLTWGTTSFAAVPVQHEPRATGSSNYTFGMLVSHAVNMLTGFSAVPLQIASVAGFAVALFGLGVLAYVLYMYSVHGQTVPGFTFLASVIAIFSGVQLFSIGVIGEYLARMHFRLMDRPAYVVGDATDESGTGAGR